MATPLENEDTIMEERSELMVSPKHTKPINPTRKLSPFLKPSSATLMDNNVKPFSLNPSFDPKTCSLNVSFNGFRIPQKGWKDWVNSMCLLHKSTWQKAGIYNAVLNSSYEIVKNDDLILGFAKKWCDETKTFVFEWGEVTVTLEDMMVVGGFSVLGHSVFSLVDIESDEAKEVLRRLDEAWDKLSRSPRNKVEQGNWMTMFKDSGSEIEHEAFLVLWLSRFVFPSTYTTVTKKVFAAAVCLGRGVKLALAPPVLASIYRDLRLLKDSLETDSHDDETNERFCHLRPNCSDSCGPRFAKWENKKSRAENIDSGFEDFCWRPHAENSNDKFGRWAVVGDCVDEELESWVRCLRVSELVGLDGKCIQQYLPHRVAMQFGMNQDVPGDVARVNGSHEIAWRFYTRPVKDVKVYIPSRVFEPYVTVRYLEWWNKSAGECSMQSPFGDNVTRNFGKIESRSKRSNVSPKHTKPLQPTYTHAPLLKPSAVNRKPCSFNHSSSPKTSTIMEERSELMVSPKHTKPTNPARKLAPFLKPSATSVDNVKPLNFNHSYDPKTCSLKVSFNGFRTLQKGWKDWVNSMCLLHKSTWQKAGIYNAVLNSSYEIIKNDDLILRFAKKWCDETNTFVFEWGEVTITLQDMMVVGGYSVLGQSAVNLADTETNESKAIIAKLNEAWVEMKRSSYSKAQQSGWMKMFKDSDSEIEHEAFLVLWLSRFVFPSSYSTVSTNVYAIAVCLSRGVKLALAPAVLASIYKDLRLLKNADQNDVIVWAPLQLLQVWIWERFKILSPNCGDSSGPRFARWEKKKISVENVNCGLEDFCWQPYAEDSNYKLGRWAVVSDCLDEELESWVRCLRVSELVGLDGKCIEQYLPHRVAMQFGMNQDVPGDVTRVNESPELAWKFYTRPVKDVEVYFPSPISNPYVTTRYLEWWNKSNGEGYLQSPIDGDETENFGKDEPTSEGSKDSVDVDTLGLELEARISKLEKLFAYLKAKKAGVTC
ncbi:Aminotransferase-like mobile domain-containing protein [Artemisia annua]|uniref:Aminotransferase-like mobile domain-containing protein n=1 Tax=Artemisia annua TaxID=35608 RepID=A0A2U1NNU3_ARTAN|nr:Aminotransferase-like mobile domain-containing protein [Artemisia annua]